MYEEFVGHPLRKDYPINRRQPLDRTGDLDGDGRRRHAARVHARRGQRRRQRHPEPCTSASGPQHPAMHGIIRIVTELDGEAIAQGRRRDRLPAPRVREGLRGGGWNNAIPYTDRLNYVSPLINNFGYAVRRREAARHRGDRALQVHPHDHVGDLAHLRPPDVRGRLGHGARRLHRLPLHDQGARVPLGAGRGRDRRAADDLLRPRRRREGRSAGRLRPTKMRKAFEETREVLDEVHRLLTGNRIFMDRMIGVGVLSREETIALRDHRARSCARSASPTTCAAPSRTGPTTAWSSRSRRRRTATTTRATSCAWRRWSSRCASPSRRWPRSRRARSTSTSRDAPIDPPAYVDQGKQGKTEGLLLVPITLSPNLQGQERAADRVNVADKRVVLPPKETAYGSIEGLMNHFMLIMEGYGIRPPAGEAYFADRGRQRRARVLRRVRRRRSPVPRALPAAVPAAARRAAPHDRGRDDRGPDPDVRLRQHDRRGARPVSDATRHSGHGAFSDRRSSREVTCALQALYPDKRGRAAAGAAHGPGDVRLRLARGRGVRGRRSSTCRRPTCTRS